MGWLNSAADTGKRRFRGDPVENREPDPPRQTQFRNCKHPEEK